MCHQTKFVTNNVLTMSRPLDQTKLRLEMGSTMICPSELRSVHLSEISVDRHLEGGENGSHSVLSNRKVVLIMGFTIILSATEYLVVV